MSPEDRERIEEIRSMSYGARGRDKDILLTRGDRLLEAIQNALERSGNRWCEWGQRAEGVAKILNEAVYGPDPDDALVDNEDGKGALKET